MKIKTNKQIKWRKKTNDAACTIEAQHFSAFASLSTKCCCGNHSQDYSYSICEKDENMTIYARQKLTVYVRQRCNFSSCEQSWFLTCWRVKTYKSQPVISTTSSHDDHDDYDVHDDHDDDAQWSVMVLAGRVRGWYSRYDGPCCDPMLYITLSTMCAPLWSTQAFVIHFFIYWRV